MNLKEKFFYASSLFIFSMGGLWAFWGRDTIIENNYYSMAYYSILICFFVLHCFGDKEFLKEVKTSGKILRLIVIISLLLLGCTYGTKQILAFVCMATQTSEEKVFEGIFEREDDLAAGMNTFVISMRLTGGQKVEWRTDKGVIWVDDRLINIGEKLKVINMGDAIRIYTKKSTLGYVVKYCEKAS